MKICISESKKFLPCFFLFCLIFFLCFCFLIFLGQRLFFDTPVSSPADSIYPTVIIDAGHGGEDGGAVGVDGSLEKDLNLAIAKKLDELLRSYGISTVMTRSDDVLLYDKNSDYSDHKKEQDLQARRRIAELYDHAVFVSIHMNAFPQSKYSGLQVYYSENDDSSFLLAQKIQSVTKEHLSPENQRKIKPSDGTSYLLEHLSCPAVLVECGFLSNPTECQQLNEKNYQKKLALCLFFSLINYFSESDKIHGTGLDFSEQIMYNEYNTLYLLGGFHERNKNRLYLFRM